MSKEAKKIKKKKAIKKPGNHERTKRSALQSRNKEIMMGLLYESIMERPKIPECFKNLIIEDPELLEMLKNL